MKALLKKIGLKRPLFYSLLIILIIIIALPLTITSIINTKYARSYISDFLFQKTKIKILPENFAITIFPQPTLQVNNHIFNPATHLELEIGKVNFHAQLHSLLMGKVLIDKISIDQPTLKQIDLLGNKQANQFSFYQEDLKLSFSSIFDFLPTHQHSLKIDFKRFKTDYFKRMDGSLLFIKENKEIVLNSRIINFSYSTKHLQNTDFKKHIDLGTILLDQLNLILKIDADMKLDGHFSGKNIKIKSDKDILLVDTDNLNSKFTISRDYTKIDVDPIQFNFPKGRVGAYFSHDQVLKNSALLFTGQNIDIVHANQMSKILFRGHRIPTNIFEVVHEGIVPKIDVSFKSKSFKELFHEDNFKLNGDLTKGIVLIPQTKIYAKEVDGNAKIIDKRLIITSNKASIDGSRLNDANLEIDLSKEIIPFNGEFSLDLNLSNIPDILISLLPGTDLANELAYVSNTKGRAKAILNLSYKPETNALDVGITTQDFSVQGNYNRIPGNIILDSINFKLIDNIVYIKNLNGKVNGHHIYNLDADFNINKNLMNINSGSGSVDLSKIIPWLSSYKTTKKLISPVISGNGNLSFTSVKILGPLLKPNNWQYSIEGSGVGIDLTTHINRKEVKDLSFKYNITSSHSKLTDISLKIVDLVCFESQFDKNYYNSIIVPLVINNATIEQNNRGSSIHGTVLFNSKTKMNLAFAGKTLKSLHLDKLDFQDPGSSDCHVTLSKKERSTQFDFSGILNFNSLKKIIKPLSHIEKQIHEITDGQSVLIHTDKKSNLNIVLNSLNLNSFFLNKKQSSLKNNWLSKKNIRLKSNQVVYKKIVLNDLDSNLRMENKNYNIKINQAKLCDLNTKGSININAQNIFIDLPFEAKNQENIQTVLTCLFNKNNFMDGKYSIQTALSSKGTTSDFLQNFEGNLKYNSMDGRIYKLTLLSRILSVLNVSKVFKGNIPDISQTGFAYKRIKIDGEVKNSKITLKKAVIDGNDMTLIFMGWIDPINDKINLTCLVAPFKTIDMIIEKIPIINTLLSGRLISVPVQATGSLSDPIVVPLHPSAVGSGLINLMTDIVKTPIRLLAKLSDDHSSTEYIL